MDKTKEPTVIHCTTTTTIVNTKTGKTYKDEQERDADVNDPNTGTTISSVMTSFKSHCARRRYKKKQDERG